jgi:hypothetical protein
VIRLSYSTVADAIARAQSDEERERAKELAVIYYSVTPPQEPVSERMAQLAAALRGTI